MALRAARRNPPGFVNQLVSFAPALVVGILAHREFTGGIAMVAIAIILMATNFTILKNPRK